MFVWLNTDHIPHLGGWNVGHFLSPLLFPSGDQCCDALAFPCSENSSNLNSSRRVRSSIKSWGRARLDIGWLVCAWTHYLLCALHFELLTLVDCLTSQQHACVSQGQICLDNFTYCHTETYVADHTCYVIQSQYIDMGPTSPPH